MMLKIKNSAFSFLCVVLAVCAVICTLIFGYKTYNESRYIEYTIYDDLLTVKIDTKTDHITVYGYDQESKEFISNTWDVGDKHN